jgi:hypothetical protein
VGERGRRHRRASGDSGATLIEFALIAPVLIALVFGIVDFGWAFNEWIALRQGAREGARQAVTGRVGTDVSCPIVGSAPPTVSTHRVVCLAKDRADLPQSKLRVKIDVEGAYNDKRSISVCLMYDLEAVSGFYGVFLDSNVLSTEVQMRIEQRTDEAVTGSTAIADYEETALPGKSWSFCSAATTS